jgi:TM2 domain-containing membrane protein YozV
MQIKLKLIFVFFFFLLLLSYQSKAINKGNHLFQGVNKTLNETVSPKAIYEIEQAEMGMISVLARPEGENTVIRKKAIAISLAITLGVFGVHRLYLGTTTKVPIIYTLTLGGGFGVLVVSDIIAIIATKELKPYSGNSNVFMWAK